MKSSSQFWEAEYLGSIFGLGTDLAGKLSSVFTGRYVILTSHALRCKKGHRASLHTLHVHHYTPLDRSSLKTADCSLCISSETSTCRSQDPSPALRRAERSCAQRDRSTLNFASNQPRHRAPRPRPHMSSLVWPVVRRLSCLATPTTRTLQQARLLAV